MIYNPPPFKGLSVRISIIIPINPIRGRGFMNKGSTLHPDDICRAYETSDVVGILCGGPGMCYLAIYGQNILSTGASD